MSGPFSGTRIAPLLEEGVFELPPNPPLVTDEGRPWVRWASVGEYAGWYTLGTRELSGEFDPDTADGFWGCICRLASEVGNGRPDACHCLGPGVLSMGGLGLTASSGFGVALLGRCLSEAPLHWVGAMGPAIHASGVFPRISSDGVDNVLLEHVEQGAILAQEQFEGALRGGSTSQRWTGAQKRLARVWVESVSRALSHPAMDLAQKNFCRDHAPRILGPAAAMIQWPTNGITDGWMFTAEQRAVWALGMVLVIEDERQAVSAFKECIQWQPEDARESLRRLRKLADREALLYSETFRRRVGHTVARVQEVFHFHLGDG